MMCDHGEGPNCRLCREVLRRLEAPAAGVAADADASQETTVVAPPPPPQEAVDAKPNPPRTDGKEEEEEQVGGAHAESKPPTTKKVHLISWNVAGWRTSLWEMARTLRVPQSRPASDALASQPSKSRGPEREEAVRSRQRALRHWLAALDCDVLALQEVKLRSADVRDAGRELCATSDAGEWESYWACNDGGAEQRAGLNGVATFAKVGDVRRADRAPLRVPELDGEGRCLLTEHAHFVLFNIYAPNSACGRRLDFKLRFYDALLEATRRERQATKKPIVLAGDLNASTRRADRHWTFTDIEPDVARSASSAWPQVLHALERRRVEPATTTNTKTGETFSKFRCYAPKVTLDAKKTDDKFVAVGSYHLSEDQAYRVCPWITLLKVLFCIPSHQALAYDEETGVNVLDFQELLDKLAGVVVSRDELRRLAQSDRDEEALTLSSPSARAVRRFIEEDGMVAAFETLHPRALERFTCWDQYRNKRHENVGSKIDHIYVDGALFRNAAPEPGRLDCGSSRLDDDAEQYSDASASAARAAATLRGRFRPAPFEGGGLPDASPSDYAHHLSVAPHTGIVYTPPSWSDHVGVSLLLRSVPCDADDAATQKKRRRGADVRDCQPHAAHAPITAFFRPQPKLSDGGGSGSGTRLHPVLPKTKKPKKQGIERFFAPSSKKTQALSSSSQGTEAASR